MTTDERRNRLFELRTNINAELAKGEFVFRPELREMLREEFKLQSECEHEYVNGICTICGMEEKG